jgi:hypothetical protein
VLSGVDQAFAVMMDMLGVVEDGGLVGRERVSGGSWVKCVGELEVLCE